MAAILAYGRQRGKVAGDFAEQGDGRVRCGQAANMDSPEQVVISADTGILISSPAVERAVAVGKEQGAKKGGLLTRSALLPFAP